MANASILAAFERMWQHILVAIGNGSADLQEQLEEKSQVQIVTWEDDD